MKLKRNIAISESGFLFDPSSGESYSINPIGMEILELLSQDQSREQITQSITNKYEIDPTDFEKYYFDFLNMLKQFQLTEDDGED